MPLETTIVCVDNSDWMRNGDYIPTRFEAQHDAVNLVTGAKTQQNPESTVGVGALRARVIARCVESVGGLAGVLCVLSGCVYRSIDR